MNKHIKLIRDVLNGLGKVIEAQPDKICFVGGTATSLYLNARIAPVNAPTDDVDVLVNVRTSAEFKEFENQIFEYGFKPYNLIFPEEGAPDYRKYFKGITVDFLPMDESITGFKNKWYEEGLKKITTIRVGSLHVPALSTEYFLATKIEAHQQRGNKVELWDSQDLEDIVCILDGHDNFTDEFLNYSDEVRSLMTDFAKKILVNEIVLMEAVRAFLVNYRAAAHVRAARVLGILKQVSQ